MKESLLQLKTQAVEMWQRMSRVQKIVIVGSAVILFGVLVLLTRGASKPDYGVLFTIKDNQEAGRIVEKLKEKKIQHQVVENGSDGGVTIMVPTKDITTMRLELASENIPTGGVVGFESLENASFGETDTDRRTRYLRALQGELTRTIEGMAEVDAARVHIVQPEPSLFIDEQKNATAAVVLKLKPYKSLEEGQIRGLIKLVTNSVEGLKSENVTIVDMAGNILSEDLSDDEETRGRRLTITQQELRKELQKEIQRDIQTMMEKMFGIGKAVVRVQLSLDFDKIQQKKHELGENVPVSTHKISEENRSTDNANPTGVPGTDSNIPGYVTQDETATSESTRDEAIVNYEISTFDEVLEKAPGSIKRLSVAVVVDKELDARVKKDVEELVKSATGFQADRGDQISVAGMLFNTEYQDRINKEIADAQKRKQMMIFGGIALLALLLIGGILTNALIKWRKRREAERQLQAELAAAVEDELLVTPVPINDIEELIETSENNEEVEEVNPEEAESERIKGYLEKAAKENPGDVAQLLKAWLAEE